MITVSQKVGRLAEIRMVAPVTIEDLASMQRDLSALLHRIQGRMVVCTDLQSATVFSTDQAERFTKLFRADNARFERNALVVGDGATFHLQVERLIREGNAPPSGPGRAEASPSREPMPAKSPRGSDPMMSRRASERRVFRSVAEAIAWLDELLTAEERSRLRTFLEGQRP